MLKRNDKRLYILSRPFFLVSKIEVFKEESETKDAPSEALGTAELYENCRFGLIEFV
jgi:hypothetical protein